jgi:hypothetical protein
MLNQAEAGIINRSCHMRFKRIDYDRLEHVLIGFGWVLTS